MPITLIYLCAAMLFIGAAPIPWYDDYTLLRIVGYSVFAFAAFISFRRKRWPLALMYAILAVAFNPFIKVHFPTEVWNLVDIVAGVLLLLPRKCSALRPEQRLDGDRPAALIKNANARRGAAFGAFLAGKARQLAFYVN